jgi:MoxR-like ATPase
MISAQNAIARLTKNIESVIIGKSDAVQLAVITLMARGHLLIEDVPGVGKTSLAQALAKSLDLNFRRI